MDALGIEMFTSGEFEQGTQHVAAGVGCAGLTRNAKSVSTTCDLNVQTSFDLSQVFVELPAKIGKAVVVGGLENDVPADLYGVQNRFRLPRHRKR